MTEENHPASQEGPEVRVPAARPCSVTSLATSCGEHGGSQLCPLVDPSEARGRAGPGRAGGGQGAAGLYRARCSIWGLEIPDPTSQACVSLPQALVTAPTPRAWRSLCTSAVAHAASRNQVSKRKLAGVSPTLPFPFFPTRRPPRKTPASTPALALTAPVTGRGRDGGGRLSSDHAARRWRGTRADARCQRGVQGKWPGGTSQQGRWGGLERPYLILTI